AAGLAEAPSVIDTIVTAAAAAQCLKTFLWPVDILVLGRAIRFPSLVTGTDDGGTVTRRTHACHRPRSERARTGTVCHSPPVSRRISSPLPGGSTSIHVWPGVSRTGSPAASR